MRISFFEEFPTKGNLNRLNLVRFPTKLYLAAKSLRDFLELKNKIVKEEKKKKILEFVYWPVLTFKEGYWISPFSSRKALKRILGELEGREIPVMLDLELPTTKNPKLYFTQFFNFIFNRKLIKEFIKNYRGEVYLAEYYPEGKRKEKLLRLLGLHYKNKKARIIKMVYHSMHHFKEEFIRKELKTGVKEYGKNYLIALGTIAGGIEGKEPILPRRQLKKDLEIAQEAGIKEAVIYRLGGLNTNYGKVLTKFADKL